MWRNKTGSTESLHSLTISPTIWKFTKHLRNISNTSKNIPRIWLPLLHADRHRPSPRSAAFRCVPRPTHPPTRSRTATATAGRRRRRRNPCVMCQMSRLCLCSYSCLYLCRWKYECSVYHVEFECATWRWSVLRGGGVCRVEVEYITLRWSVVHRGAVYWVEVWVDCTM